MGVPDFLGCQISRDTGLLPLLTLRAGFRVSRSQCQPGQQKSGYYTLLSLLRSVFLERSVSTCRAMEQIIIYWLNPGVNPLFCTWSCLRAARFCACRALSGFRVSPTGPDGSHLVLMLPPSLGGGGSGGGSRGGPVGSFTRTSLSHSLLQRHAPRHAPGPKTMQLVHSILLENKLSAPVIDNYTQYRSLAVIAGKCSNTIYLL